MVSGALRLHKERKMRHLKILGLLAIAAAALLAFTASASATEATAPAGTVYTKTLKGENVGAITFHGITDITCQKSTLEGSIEQHGPAVTGKGKGINFTWSECGSAHISTVSTGTIEVHSVGSGNGTITSTGTRGTLLMTTIFGPVHCVYETNNTDLGTVTGATSDTGHATIHLNAVIPVDPKASSALCGESGQLTATGKVTTPTGLRVD